MVVHGKGKAAAMLIDSAPKGGSGSTAAADPIGDDSGVRKEGVETSNAVVNDANDNKDDDDVIAVLSQSPAVSRQQSRIATRATRKRSLGDSDIEVIESSPHTPSTRKRQRVTSNDNGSNLDDNHDNVLQVVAEQTDKSPSPTPLPAASSNVIEVDGISAATLDQMRRKNMRNAPQSTPATATDDVMVLRSTPATRPPPRRHSHPRRIMRPSRGARRGRAVSVTQPVSARTRIHVHLNAGDDNDDDDSEYNPDNDHFYDDDDNYEYDFDFDYDDEDYDYEPSLSSEMEHPNDLGWRIVSPYDGDLDSVTQSHMSHAQQVLWNALEGGSRASNRNRRHGMLASAITYGLGGGGDSQYEEYLRLCDSLGDHTPGAEKSAINALTTWKFNKKMFDAANAANAAHDSAADGVAREKAVATLPDPSIVNSESCPICMDDFKSNQVIKGTPCKHWFHTKCITKWLRSHKNCPICRFHI